MAKKFVLLAAILGVALANPGFQGRGSVFGKNAVLNKDVYKDDNPAVDNRDIMEMIRHQSTQVTEVTLNDQTKKGCFMRTVCVVGTMEMAETPRYSMASGIMEFKNMLKEMVDGMKMNPQMTNKEYPNIHRTLASFEVGSKTKDAHMCEQLFTCATTAKDLTEHVLMMPPMRDGRATCKAAGALCPGVSIACAMCGVFLPGTCGDQCIIAGLYCGVSGYACKAAAADEAAVIAEEHPEEPAPATVLKGTPKKGKKNLAQREEELMAYLFGPRYLQHA